MCDGELIPQGPHPSKFATSPGELTFHQVIQPPKVDHGQGNESRKTSGKVITQPGAPQWKLQPKLNYDDDDDET